MNEAKFNDIAEVCEAQYDLNVDFSKRHRCFCGDHVCGYKFRCDPKDTECNPVPELIPEYKNLENRDNNQFYMSSGIKKLAHDPEEIFTQVFQISVGYVHAIVTFCGDKVTSKKDLFTTVAKRNCVDVQLQGHLPNKPTTKTD